MEVRTEFYVAPVDGARCLRVAGRARRTSLPVAAAPPADVEPALCFLCHPDSDPLDRGAWPLEAPIVRVLDNAFPVARRSLLVAPPGERDHRGTPATLATGAILRLGMDEAFRVHFGLEHERVSMFWNVGTLAGQSRGHPHAQVVSLAPDLPVESAAGTIRHDLERAQTEGRALELAGGAGTLVIPARPSMTAEAWLPVRLRGDANEAARFDAAVHQVVEATERAISGNYNLVLLPSANILRVIPRGISERAGLEFAFPGAIDNVVATSVSESREIWQTALQAPRESR